MNTKNSSERGQALVLIAFPQGERWVLWIGLLAYLGLTLSTLTRRMLHIHKRFNLLPPCSS